MLFAWDEWNVGHIAEHGVSPDEAEYVIRSATPPFPRDLGHGKHVVWGATEAGRLLQVVFAYRSEDQLDFDSIEMTDLAALSNGSATAVVYIVHAMPLSGRLLHQYRRTRRSQ
jgi:uncharacterized DUF497 family protein